MSALLILNKMCENFERAALIAARNFQRFDELKALCRDPNCEYCARPAALRDIHRENMRLIRNMLGSISLYSTVSVKLELDPRPGHGLWNGYITDDGYFINGRVGVGENSGDVGHASLKEDYRLVFGEERANALLKVHAQHRSEIILSNDSPVLTKAQLSTLSEICTITPEELWFTFRYDLQHPMKDIPF